MTKVRAWPADNAPVDQQSANILRKLEKPQRVGDMAAALADHLPEVGLGMAVIVDELLVAHRLLDRIEIGPLDVLDDRQFQRRTVVDLPHDDRNFGAGPHAAQQRQRRSPAMIS